VLLLLLFLLRLLLLFILTRLGFPALQRPLESPVCWTHFLPVQLIQGI
jgi:hypothetical protein